MVQPDLLPCLLCGAKRDSLGDVPLFCGYECYQLYRSRLFDQAMAAGAAIGDEKRIGFLEHGYDSGLLSRALPVLKQVDEG